MRGIRSVKSNSGANFWRANRARDGCAKPLEIRRFVILLCTLRPRFCSKVEIVFTCQLVQEKMFSHNSVQSNDLPRTAMLDKPIFNDLGYKRDKRLSRVWRDSCS